MRTLVIAIVLMFSFSVLAQRVKENIKQQSLVQDSGKQVKVNSKKKGQGKKKAPSPVSN